MFINYSSFSVILSLTIFINPIVRLAGEKPSSEGEKSSAKEEELKTDAREVEASKENGDTPGSPDNTRDEENPGNTSGQEDAKADEVDAKEDEVDAKEDEVTENGLAEEPPKDGSNSEGEKNNTEPDGDD